MAITRSVSRSWITMSFTAMLGSPDFSWVQVCPPSGLKKAPNSVPANSRSLFSVSCSMVCTAPLSGRLPLIDVQFLPLSVLFNRYGLKSSRLWLSKEAYTTLASNLSGMISLTYVYSGTPGKFFTWNQLPPASSVTDITPSSVPTYTRSSLTFDSASDTAMPKSEVETSFCTASMPQ